MVCDSYFNRFYAAESKICLILFRMALNGTFFHYYFFFFQKEQTMHSALIKNSWKRVTRRGSFVDFFLNTALKHVTCEIKKYNQRGTIYIIEKKNIFIHQSSNGIYDFHYWEEEKRVERSEIKLMKIIASDESSDVHANVQCSFCSMQLQARLASSFFLT